MDSLEQFARIRAAIERGTARDRALRDAGLSPAEWIRLQRRWLGALAADVERGNDALADRYWNAFHAAQSPAHPPPPDAPAAQGPAAAAVAVEPGSVSVRVPSYLKASPVAAPSLEVTANAVDAPPAPAVPFRPAPAAPEPERVGTGTAIAPAGPVGPEMPFEPLSPEALGFTLLRYAEIVAAIDEALGDVSVVLARFGLDAGTHARVEAHWRGRMAESPGLALKFGRLFVQAKKALAERREPRAADAAAGSTALDLSGFRPPRATRGEAHPVPEMTVEQYAWLVATLGRTSAPDLPAVLARLRLTADSRREMESRWAARFAADGALQATFLRALERHRSGGGG